MADYVVSSVQDAAKRTLETRDVIALSAAEIVDALLHSPPVNARLRDIVRRYRAMTG